MRHLKREEGHPYKLSKVEEMEESGHCYTEMSIREMLYYRTSYNKQEVCNQDCEREIHE